MLNHVLFWLAAFHNFRKFEYGRSRQGGLEREGVVPDRYHCTWEIPILCALYSLQAQFFRGLYKLFLCVLTNEVEGWASTRIWRYMCSLYRVLCISNFRLSSAGAGEHLGEVDHHCIFSSPVNKLLSFDWLAMLTHTVYHCLCFAGISGLYVTCKDECAAQLRSGAADAPITSLASATPVP